MLVEKWMTREVITVDEEDSMQKAAKLLAQNKIRMLPVMKNGELVGVVSDRDIKKASASDATTFDKHELGYLIEQVKVKQIMTTDIITISSNFTMEEAAEILLKNRISGAPVIDEKGILTGIVTQSDMFKEMISLAGIGKKGLQIACAVEDRPGIISDLTSVVRKYGGRIVSILTTYENENNEKLLVYIRAYGVDRSRFTEFNDDLISLSTLMYIVDHREMTRRIFEPR